MTDMADYYDIEVKYYDEEKPVVVRCLNKERLIAVMERHLDDRKICLKKYGYHKCRSMHVVEWIKIY